MDNWTPKCLVCNNYLFIQGGSVERAADWVFSHADELDSPDQGQPEGESQDKYHDGLGSKCISASCIVVYYCTEYQLVAFISHMGTSTMFGHYVCHIKREGRWVIYNDNKVAESVAPPKDLAYLYLYKRTSA